MKNMSKSVVRSEYVLRKKRKVIQFDSDGSISAIHGITLSAWAFAGLTGNQMANAIVKAVENKITAEGGSLPQILYHGEMQAVNPVGYQTVLYVTLALYVVSLCLSLFLVKPINKDKASA